MQLSSEDIKKETSKSTPDSACTPELKTTSSQPLAQDPSSLNSSPPNPESSEENLRRPIGSLGSLQEGTEILGVFVPGQPGYEELRKILGMKPLGWKPTPYKKQVLSEDEHKNSLGPDEHEDP
jgi:hypothetical protein